MSEDFIGYGQLIDDAMHIIVQKALKLAEDGGLRGNHHFFVSFITEYPGVQISEKLREKYPDEMTIVLQYQYEDLKVTEEGFSVTLSFDNVKEHIYVPFAALSAFADPSVKFGLQFRHMEAFDEDDEELSAIAEVKEFITPEPGDALNDADGEGDKPAKRATAAKGKKKPAAKSKKKPQAENSNVVDLDNFRKK